MSWKNPPSNFSTTVKKDMEKTTKNVATTLLRDLIFSSPVDTGRFRNNWIASLKKRSDATYPASKGLGAISRGESTIKQHKAVASIFITNNLPYAKALNDGHSKQAPINFVQKAIRRALK